MLTFIFMLLFLISLFKLYIGQNMSFYLFWYQLLVNNYQVLDEKISTRQQREWQLPKDNFQHHIKYRDALYIRVTLSFFMVGLSTFALLYFVQPILPILSSEFKITPAQSSMSLSLCTGLLALGLLVTGPFPMR